LASRLFFTHGCVASRLNLTLRERDNLDVFLFYLSDKRATRFPATLYLAVKIPALKRYIPMFLKGTQKFGNPIAILSVREYFPDE
jgi:hypothetical protein